MKRVTEKNKMARFGYKYLCGLDDFGEGIVKLGQLEDIEEELGIALITLFKALKNGVFIPTYQKPIHISVELSFIDTFTLVDYDSYTVLKLIDYGKTWALTKEELE